MDRPRALVLFGTISLLSAGFAEASFPENKLPRFVTSVNDVPYSVFTGGDGTPDLLRYTQDVKMVKVAGRDYYAITGREKLFLVHPDKFSPVVNAKVPFDEVFTWNTDKDARRLCVMKGQGEENCQNYIRVMEQTDKNGSSFLVCATNSFDPRCLNLTASLEGDKIVLEEHGKRFSGTERCAFGPEQTGVSLFTGNSLYSGTVSEFSGRSYTITRGLGDDQQLRTPKFDSKFLNEPHFVKMIEDGEKVLIFMNELVRSYGGDIRMVAYVAQVCKNDVGGQHVLVRQWTKFVKSRLNCSLNGFYFDQLQDVSDPVEVSAIAESKEKVKTIYATFSTPDHSVPGSAVCSFTLDSIHDALLGRFREERGGSKSNAPSGSMHPGRCPNKRYSESELQFLKSHPLLEDQARGSLLTTHSGETWTSVAVDAQAGPEKNWTVYFVGTAKGQVLRYLAPAGDLKNAVPLRRQDVYDVSKCASNVTEAEEKSVNRIMVDTERDQILVTFKHCITSIPLRSCSVHKCRKSCIASADPYCGWNGSLCVSYSASSVNVEQYIFSEATHPRRNVEDLCPEEDNPPLLNKGETIPPKETPAEEEGDSDGANKPSYNITNGTFIDEQKNKDRDIVHQQQGMDISEAGSILWYYVVAIAFATAIVSLFVGCMFRKACCTAKKTDAEKQSDVIDASRASLSNGEGLCKKFIARISPKRGRKQSMKTPSLGQSQENLAEQRKELLYTKDSKSDELVKPRNPSTSDTLNKQMRQSSKLNSTGSASQITVTESLGSMPIGSRRQSYQQPPTSSMTSMSSKGRQYFTAPRIRNYSGNRTSDPSDYSNLPTLRADKANPRSSSRHSTPNPVPTTPSSHKEFFANGSESLETLDHVLDGVKEVIEQTEQRLSAEMETVFEETEETRQRHNSSDSGKGSSPRNSVQTAEDQDKVSSLSRHWRPENITIGSVPARGRKRLNSEPTSPTVGPPLPPPASRKPVSRSVSMRSQHAMSVPSYPPRNSGESFSYQHHAAIPHGTQLGIHQMVKNGFTPKAQSNTYATMPHSSSTPQPPRENFSRQQSYDTYSPHKRHEWPEHQEHPAMQLADRYSSLPSRSQAHRTNNKPFSAHYPHHSTQMNGGPHHAQMNGRKNNAVSRPPPPFTKQISSPAGFDQQRKGQRGIYVTPPKVPTTYSVPLHEQDAV